MSVQQQGFRLHRSARPLTAFGVALWLIGAAVLPCSGQGPADAGPAEPGPADRPLAQSIEDLLLFFPAKYPRGDWQPQGLRFRDVFFTAEDGTRLHGWYCPAEKPRAVILAAHGNAGHVASRAPWLRYLQNRASVSVFMFDYRGYGRSGGQPTIAGALQDATAARAKLRELAGVQDSEMLLMGESLGGAIVVRLAAQSPPRGLILQSTFPSLRDAADVHFPKLSWLVRRDQLDSAAALASLRVPLLQSHGTADRTIPFSLGEKLFAAASEPKQFVRIEQAGHNNWLTEPYLKQLDAFITQHSSPP